MIILLAAGLSAGFVLGRKFAVRDARQTTKGCRIPWNDEILPQVFGGQGVLPEMAAAERQRLIWEPEWTALSWGELCPVGDYLFYMGYGTLEVYDKDLKLVRQLADYSLNHAMTNGDIVYVITGPIADTDSNDMFARWELDSNELVFMAPIWLYPKWLFSGFAGANSDGIYFYAADYSDAWSQWYCYSFETERTMDLGLVEGYPVYVGEDFYLTKAVPSGMERTPYAPGELYVVDMAGNERMRISRQMTQFQVYDHKVYFLEDTDRGRVFKCYDMDTREAEALGGPEEISAVAGFQLLFGDRGAVYCGWDDSPSKSNYPVQYICFEDGSVLDASAGNTTLFYGGAAGYVIDEQKQNIYRYEPFSSADTLVYTAPDGWDARSVADMGDGQICVLLMSKSNAQAHKLVRVEAIAPDS